MILSGNFRSNCHSDFIRFDNQPTTIPFLTISPSRTHNFGIGKPNRFRPKPSTTTTPISSNSSISCYINIHFLIFIIYNFIK
jgi:hypothetical protein